MKKTTIYIVTALLCLNFSSKGQVITPLKIGDKLPNEVWNLPLQTVKPSGEKKIITLNTYRGKLIILDFWATWCGGCIKAMPRLKAIQKALNEKLIILPITTETEAVVKSFLAKNVTVRKLNLETVIDGTGIKNIFPHHIIPHLVWISPSGIIQTTTNPEEVRVESVEEAVGEKPLTVNNKIDVDMAKPLFFRDDIPKNVSFEQYAILIKGLVAGLPGGGAVKRIKDNKQYGIAYPNLPLNAIYDDIGKNLIQNFTSYRVIIRMSVADSIEYARKQTDTEEFYTYEYDVPLKYATSLFQRMLDNLNTLSDYTAVVIKVNKPCLTVEIDDEYSQLKSHNATPNIYRDEKNIFHIVNQPFSKLIELLIYEESLKDYAFLNSPILDSRIDISLELPFSNLESARKKLKKYGIKLVESIQPADMLVITKKL